RVEELSPANRAVSKKNIIVLDLPAGEDISRDDYDRRLAAPLRDALKDRREQAKVLLTVYGVPLRVAGSKPSKEEEAELAKVKAEAGKLRQEEKRLQKEVADLDAKAKGKGDAAAEAARALAERRKQLQ